MPVFVAHVEFRFEAESLEAGGRRLRELSEASRSAGFELKHGWVEPEPPDDAATTADGWTRYTPDGA